MVFTLHKYIFRELTRVFILTALALTFLLSLGSMVHRLQEYGVGPDQAVRLLGYFIPITLTVVLPISALFATALTYGRFASDNELDACRASGISLMTLVYPGLCLAVAVSITTLILSFYVVPAFVHRAERAVQANAKQIVFRNIQRKGFYEMPGGRFKIYADEAVPQIDTLHGVVIVESKRKNISKHIFAKTAKVEIETTKRANVVTAVAENVYQLDADGSQNNFVTFPVKHTFPPLLTDNIKFLKIDRLKEIKADMANFGPVREEILEARAQLVIEMLAEDIQRKFLSNDSNYYQMVSSDRIITFNAASARAENNKTIKLEPPIDLLEYDPVSRQLDHRWRSDDPAVIRLEDNEPGSKLAMVIKNTSWESKASQKSFTPTPQKVVHGVLLPPDLDTRLKRVSLIDSIESIGTDNSNGLLQSNPSGTLKDLKNRVTYSIWQTSKAISAEIHTRLVFGIGCITLVLFAIALGIIFKGGHLLSAFGTSAIPAGILVVFIMSGKELTKTKNAAIPEGTGVMVMWAGLLILSIVCVLIYRKLTRT